MFIFAGWHISSLLLETPALPTPIETVPVLIEYASALSSDFFISFYRVAISLVIAVVLGAPLGLWLGRAGIAETLFTPVFYILYPVPKIVILPILLVLLGLGHAPKIVLIALTIFFQVVIVMHDAAKNLPEQTIQSMRSLGAGKADMWRHVIIPASLPELFTCLRVSSGIAIAILFFAEAIAGSTGLGYFIMNSWAMVNYARMFAGIIALAVLGLIFYLVFDIVERLVNAHR
ncbi:MAG: ABC transporter permease subunit [Eggerthellaceae bacterium]|nr:ABC transporter permease subunit [Eggerthellaceae bacterium]